MARSSCILESPSAADRPHCGEIVSGEKGGREEGNRGTSDSRVTKEKRMKN